MPRRIIHLNIAHFQAAVEQLRDRSLASRPLIIAERAARAVVLDMNEEAYREGVRKGMPLTRARYRCPGARLLPPAPRQYEKMMQACLQRALVFTPLVEQAPGMGHVYLDVSGTNRLFGPPPDIGRRLRRVLEKELGLIPVWTLAANRLVARAASRTVKTRGECVVEAGREREFLAPLPLALLPGVDGNAKYRLQQVGIRRIGQAALLRPAELSILCGRAAETMYHALRGIDHTPVAPAAHAPDQRQPALHHFCRPPVNCEQSLCRAACALAARLGALLRCRGLAARRLALRLVYCDGVESVRRVLLKKPLQDDQGLSRQAEDLLFRCLRRRVLVSEIELRCLQRITHARQLSLFEDINKKEQKQRELGLAVDYLHEKYGRDILRRT